MFYSHLFQENEYTSLIKGRRLKTAVFFEFTLTVLHLMFYGHLVIIYSLLPGFDYGCSGMVVLSSGNNTFE